MNTFFYAASASSIGKDCLMKLLQFSELEHMAVLSGVSLFLSPLSLKLRSGDLIILFAADKKELDEFITLRNDFSNFRIILILADSDSETICKAHLLQPSFIAFVEEKIVTLEAVINKMTEANSKSAFLSPTERVYSKDKRYHTRLSREHSACMTTDRRLHGEQI